MSIRSGSATLTCEAGVSARTKERTHLPTSAQHETEHFHQYVQMPPRRSTGSGRDQRDTRIALTGRHRPDGLPTVTSLPQRLDSASAASTSWWVTFQPLAEYLVCMSFRVCSKDLGETAETTVRPP